MSYLKYRPSLRYHLEQGGFACKLDYLQGCEQLGVLDPLETSLSSL